MAKKRLVVIEDQTAIREMLVEILGKSRNYFFAGEAGDGKRPPSLRRGEAGRCPPRRQAPRDPRPGLAAPPRSPAFRLFAFWCFPVMKALC